MTTDELIQKIAEMLEAHVPGTYANGLKLAKFLREQAEKTEAEVDDDMSLPSD